MKNPLMLKPIKFPATTERALSLSYPKSGRTWLRFMIDDYMVRLHGVKLKNVFKVEKTPEGAPLWWSHLRGRLAHESRPVMLGAFDWEGLRDRRCVFLMRNFYATLASSYHFVNSGEEHPASPGEFLRDPYVGAVKLVSFYNLWEEIRSVVPAYHLVSYENIKADPAATLEGVLQFVGVPLDLGLVKTIAQEATFQRLRELSLSEDYVDSPLYVSPAGPNSYKVRKGSNLDYKSLFSREEIAYIASVIDLLLINREPPYGDLALEPNAT